jgi:poly(3-hydroxybutyrate) depolymerase
MLFRIIAVTLFVWSMTASNAYAQANKEPNYGSKEKFVEIDGVRSRYLVLSPAGLKKDTPAPVWIGLHGVVGCSEHAMWAWHDAASKLGVILIAPQGTEPDKGEGYNRWNDDRDSRSFLLMLDDVEREQAIDRSRISLVGFSRGAALALYTLQRYPEQFHFVGVIAGAFWGEIEDAGLRTAAARGVTTFYGCGQADRGVYRRFAATLSRLHDLGFAVHSYNPVGVAHDPRPFNSALSFAYSQAKPLEKIQAAPTKSDIDAISPKPNASD